MTPSVGYTSALILVLFGCYRAKAGQSSCDLSTKLEEAAEVLHVIYQYSMLSQLPLSRTGFSLGTKAHSALKDTLFRNARRYLEPSKIYTAIRKMGAVH